MDSARLGLRCLCTNKISLLHLSRTVKSFVFHLHKYENSISQETTHSKFLKNDPCIVLYAYIAAETMV